MRYAGSVLMLSGVSATNMMHAHFCGWACEDFGARNLGIAADAQPRAVCIRWSNLLAVSGMRSSSSAKAPFVLGCRRKYSMELRILRCRIRFVTYRFNALRVNEQGATQMHPFKQREASFSSFRFSELSQPI
jgi:hypothetical protein